MQRRRSANHAGHHHRPKDASHTTGPGTRHDRSLVAAPLTPEDDRCSRSAAGTRQKSPAEPSVGDKREVSSKRGRLPLRPDRQRQTRQQPDQRARFPRVAGQAAPRLRCSSRNQSRARAQSNPGSESDRRRRCSTPAAVTRSLRLLSSHSTRRSRPCRPGRSDRQVLRKGWRSRRAVRRTTFDAIVRRISDWGAATLSTHPAGCRRRALATAVAVVAQSCLRACSAESGPPSICIRLPPSRSGPIRTGANPIPSNSS